MAANNDIPDSDLFQKYLDVCNRALKANKDRFPFKQILQAVQTEEEARTVEVSIVDDRPSSDFMIQLKSDKIQAERHNTCGNCQCDGKWNVRKSYLEDVVRNPQKYIDNPARIDWDWMYRSDQKL